MGLARDTHEPRSVPFAPFLPREMVVRVKPVCGRTSTELAGTNAHCERLRLVTVAGRLDGRHRIGPDGRDVHGAVAAGEGIPVPVLFKMYDAGCFMLDGRNKPARPLQEQALAIDEPAQPAGEGLAAGCS